MIPSTNEGGIEAIGGYTMRSTNSSSLRSRYDYYYSSPTSATSTAATNYYENQHASLFGDPVPPSTGFLENLDSHLYGRFRQFSGTTKSNNSTLFDDYSSHARYYNQAKETFRPESRATSEITASNYRPHVIENSIYGSEFPRSTSAVSSDFRANLEHFR